jgi:hypothetical protein
MLSKMCKIIISLFFENQIGMCGFLFSSHEHQVNDSYHEIDTILFLKLPLWKQWKRMCGMMILKR